MDVLLAFLILFLFAAIILMFPVLLLIGWRAQRLVWGKSYSEKGWINLWAHRWYRAIERSRAKQAERAELARQLNAAKEDAPARAAIKAEKSTFALPPAAEAEDRLEEAFERFRDGDLSLADYRSLIENEIEDAELQRDWLREDRRTMDRDLYALEMEDVKAALEAAKWRLKWVDDRQYKDQFKRDGFEESGKWARFAYVDHHGEITSRSITNWERRGTYILGWDRDKRAERTFRQDRIRDWEAG